MRCCGPLRSHLPAAEAAGLRSNPRYRNPLAADCAESFLRCLYAHCACRTVPIFVAQAAGRGAGEAADIFAAVCTLAPVGKVVLYWGALWGMAVGKHSWGDRLHGFGGRNRHFGEYSDYTCNHLPVGNSCPFWPRADVASRAIFAARMAFSKR